jgi:hypothetical protein
VRVRWAVSCSKSLGVRETYAQLLVVAGALLAGGLELLAHLADLLVNLGVLCGGHGAVVMQVSTVSRTQNSAGEHTWCWCCVREVDRVCVRELVRGRDVSW